MIPFNLPSSFRRLALTLGAVFALVLAPAQAVAMPPLKPTIYAFLVLGESVINRGDSAVLAWAVGNATTVAISPDVGVVSGTEVWVAPTTTTTYTLTATNAAGSVTQHRKVTVVVTPAIRSLVAAPDSILAGAAARLGSPKASGGALRWTGQVARE